MAIVATPTDARYRFADNNSKTIASYSGINPSVSDNSSSLFAASISAMMTKPVITNYLVVETELADDGE
jgi:hypothetical protein